MVKPTITKKSTFSVPLSPLRYAKYITFKADQLKDEIRDGNMTTLQRLYFLPDVRHGVNFGWQMSSVFSDTYTMSLSDVKVKNIINKHIEKYLHFDILITDNTDEFKSAWEISYTNHKNNQTIPIKEKNYFI